MSKKRKGIRGMSVGIADILAASIGGVAGGYINKLGTYSPVFPDQAGAAANIIVGALVKMFAPGMVANGGLGMVAVGVHDLAHSFGIGGEEFVNGMDNDNDSRMIAEYQRRKAINGSRVINGSIINGYLADNAVPRDTDFNDN